jgi:hypothetical protein
MLRLRANKRCFERPSSTKDVWYSNEEPLLYCLICGVMSHLLLNPSTTTATAKWTGIVQTASAFHYLPAGFLIRKRRGGIRIVTTCCLLQMASLWTWVEYIGFSLSLDLAINKNKTGVTT